jgi:hypothetical protein
MKFKYSILFLKESITRLENQIATMKDFHNFQQVFFLENEKLSIEKELSELLKL